jgi:hypothetical protein
LLAFSKNLEWKAPETASGTTLFAPASSSNSLALETADSSPVRTIWTGEL